MRCIKCGKVLSEEDVFCSVCGTKAEKQQEKVLLEFVRQNKLPVSIIAILLVIALGFMLHSVHEKNETNRMWKAYMQSQNNDSYYSGGAGYDYHRYENSTYKIGDTMPAGEYVLFASSGSVSGYFCLSSDSSGDSIIANDNFNYTSIITVREGEYLELSRCYAEPISSAGTLSTTGEGMFKIGVHLPAGEYKLEATSDSGYFCVYDDGRQDDIYNNDNFSGVTYVTVREGQYLELSRCKIVK